MNFGVDGSTGDLGAGVQACYIALKSGLIAEIFTTRVHAVNHCRFIGAPNEKGLQEFDNKVQLPNEVTLTGIVKPAGWECLKKARSEIGQNKVLRGKCYTKDAVFDNMMIESIEETSSAERFDGVEVVIRMKEYIEEGQKMY